MKIQNLFIFSLLLWNTTAMAIEEPSFKVISKTGTFEVRQYAPMLVAETTVEGDMDEASNRGFRRIADYIFGNNQSAQSGNAAKIAMTAPVTLEPQSEKIAMTAPVTIEADTSSKIAFMLKKDSLVGKTIITNKNFSINVLNAEQELLARYYSNVRSPDTIGENKWDILNDKFAHIKNARIVLDCEHHDIFDEYPANIYVARVVDSSVNKALLPLIYESRNFINLNKWF